MNQKGFTLIEILVAMAVGIEYIEAIKQLPFAPTYPDAGDGIDVPFQYTVTVDTECSSDGETFGPCTGSEDETSHKIIVRVSREGGKPVLSIYAYRTKR